MFTWNIVTICRIELLTVNISREYVPGKHVVITSDVIVEGQAHPGGQGMHSPTPMGLYDPSVQKSVGGAVVTSQE